MTSADKKTRSSINPDVDFPPFDDSEWLKSGHLPSLAEVIGAVRFSTNKKVSASAACTKVAVRIVSESTARNVYSKSPNTVKFELNNV